MIHIEIADAEHIKIRMQFTCIPNTKCTLFGQISIRIRNDWLRAVFIRENSMKNTHTHEQTFLSSKTESIKCVHQSQAMSETENGDTDKVASFQQVDINLCH